MRKILIIILIIIGFNNAYASGLYEEVENNTCTESKCINDRINELIKINEKLYDENLTLKINKESFNLGLKNYINTLEESKKISEEKGKAYNEALNNLKFWVSIIGFILGIILIYFGINRNTELKKAKDDILKEVGEYKSDFKDYKDELKESFGEYKQQVISFKEDLKGSLKEEFKKTLEENLKNELKTEFSVKLQSSIDSGDGIEKYVTEKLLNEIVDKLYNNKSDKIIAELNQSITPDITIKIDKLEDKFADINRKLDDLGI